LTGDYITGFSWKSASASAQHTKKKENGRRVWYGEAALKRRRPSKGDFATTRFALGQTQHD